MSPHSQHRLTYSVVAWALSFLYPSGAAAHGDVHAHIETLTREIAGAPGTAALYLRRGELHRVHQNLEAALADYRKAAALDPLNDVVDLCAGRALSEGGRGHEARPYLERYARRHGDDAEVFIVRARTLASLGAPFAITAAADYDRAIALIARPKPDLFVERARVLAVLGRPADALASLEKVIEIAAGCGAHLLVDETYRDVSSVKKPPLAASIDPRAISVSSVSKAYGLPGIRIGWIICRDAGLMNRFLAAKEQIFICNSVVDETIALRFLEKQGTFLPRIRARTERKYELLEQFMAQSKAMEWVRPDAAVVGFPRFKPDLNIDTDAFYRLLLEKYKTMVGPGHWFDMPDRYMRIGFGYPTEAAMRKGLLNLAVAVQSSGRK